MVFEESVVLPTTFEEAVERTKAAFAEVGFGVLTDIDVQSTLKNKLGKEMGPYRILGACNPELASQALDAEPCIGVLLPCNVVVREAADGVVVEAMDPGIMAHMVESDTVRALADEARRLVGDAMVRLSSHS